MVSSNHTIAKIAVQAARRDGWDVSNYGEAQVALALARLGYKPADVETQFRLGQYRIDFALPASRIAIEADGWVHTARDVRARDRQRDRQMKAWGWTVVRIRTDEDITGQLRRHVPSRREIDDYGQIMRHVDCIFEAYLYRLQDTGVCDPREQLARMRDMIKAAWQELNSTRRAAPAQQL